MKTLNFKEANGSVKSHKKCWNRGKGIEGTRRFDYLVDLNIWLIYDILFPRLVKKT